MDDPSTLNSSSARRRKRTFGVYIGRFEPPHNAHLAVMQEALQEVQKLIVVIGSARGARSTKNPFTFEERQSMISAMLQEAGVARSRVLFAQVRDYFYNESLWLSEVQRGVDAHTHGSSDVALIGHLKDESSYYLRSFPAWEFLPAHVVSPLSATQVRQAYFGGGDTAPLVPSAVQGFLSRFRHTPDYTELKQEFEYLAAYRAAWAGSPFPPVFVTTDAAVIRSGHVLLVRRGGQPGHGRLAMPGGFLDVHETLLTSCIQKVRQETGLTTATPLETSLRSQAVFDYPERSLRGRTITHAFHFDLGAGQLPAVRPGPMNDHALWMPLSQALAQPEAFFEDHHAIIEQFVLKG